MEGRHLVRSRLSVTFMELLLFTSEEPEDVRDVSHPQGHVRAGSSTPGEWTLAAQPSRGLTLLPPPRTAARAARIYVASALGKPHWL